MAHYIRSACDASRSFMSDRHQANCVGALAYPGRGHISGGDAKDTQSNASIGCALRAKVRLLPLAPNAFRLHTHASPSRVGATKPAPSIGRRVRDWTEMVR